MIRLVKKIKFEMKISCFVYSYDVIEWMKQQNQLYLCKNDRNK